MFHLFSNQLKFKRKEIIESKIENMFKQGNGYEIIRLIYEENNIFYPYLLNAFKKYELEDLNNIPYFFDNPHRILLQIDNVFDMENYLNICLKCIKKKDHKFMIERIEDIIEILIYILIDYILIEMKEIIPQYTLELLENGKTIEEISKLYIESAIHDELPSLRSLYTKETYEYIVEELCKIDEDELEDFDFGDI